ncbi:hypothetical protein ACVWW3_001374 [Bradyrhizobium sp. LM2.9]
MAVVTPSNSFVNRVDDNELPNTVASGSAGAVPSNVVSEVLSSSVVILPSRN